ncbi:MAG: hypothetical protein AVDCRST_MAG73-3116, partial [uncultured Thermomicrobiales bacterium]
GTMADRGDRQRAGFDPDPRLRCHRPDGAVRLRRSALPAPPVAAAVGRGTAAGGCDADCECGPRTWRAIGPRGAGGRLGQPSRAGGRGRRRHPRHRGLPRRGRRAVLRVAGGGDRLGTAGRAVPGRGRGVAGRARRVAGDAAARLRPPHPRRRPPHRRALRPRPRAWRGGRWDDPDRSDPHGSEPPDPSAPDQRRWRAGRGAARSRFCPGRGALLLPRRARRRADRPRRRGDGPGATDAHLDPRGLRWSGRAIAPARRQGL